MTYKLAFFDDPPRSAINTAESKSHAVAAQMALGRVGIFVDAGSDGFFNRDKDILIAADSNTFLLWRRVIIARKDLTEEDNHELATLREMPFGFCLAGERWEAAEYEGMECTQVDKSRVDFTVNEEDITNLNRKLQDELSRPRKVLPDLGTPRESTSGDC